MKLKLTLTALAAAMTVAGTPSARAQSAKDFEDMRQEIKRLRDEVDALKKQKADEAKPADSSGWGDRIEALEIKQKDAVVLGDIGGGGGFRLPGSETSIRVYGYAEGDVIHDFNATAPNDNYTNLIEQPLKNSGAPKGATKLSAETSRFGFETTTPTQYGAFTTKLEGDFYSFGDGTTRNRLRIRHAYGEYNGLLVGQTWGTFMDVDDLPETVDFNGPIGSPFVRKAMVRYTYNNPDIAKFAVAIEDPAGGSQMPDIVARADKTFGWGALNVRLLAHEKRATDVGVDEKKYGFGFGLGGSFKASDKDLLMAQYAYVTGDFDNQYGSNSYVVATNEDGSPRILFDKNHGLIVGWSHIESDQWRGTLSYGMNRSAADGDFRDAIGRGVGNRSLDQMFLNVIYTPIKNVDLGGEYTYGRRKTYDDEIGIMSRFTLMGRYTF